MEYTTGIAVVLGVIGAIFGSFVGAQVWRLRLRQLKDDQKHGEPIDKKELHWLEQLDSKKVAGDRSRCLHCQRQLAWHDMIPVVSWLVLKGKCRYCRSSIGITELLLEVGMASFFAVSFLIWPYSLHEWPAVLHFVLWLSAGVLLGLLLVYDAKWCILPNRINWLFVGVAALFCLITVAIQGVSAGILLNIAASIAILSGVYLLLFIISKGAWIGFGDIKLGLGLALLLSNWKLAFLALFLANFIGCLVVLPGLLTKKIQRTSHVPFGPFLIAGTVLSFFAGEAIIQWYLAWGMGWFSGIPLVL